MYTKSKLANVVLVIFLTTFLLLGSSLAANTDDKKSHDTIKGTVTAAEQDDQGNVSAVAIVVSKSADKAEDQKATKRYLVAQNDKGNELIDLVGQKVEVKGKISENAQGEKTIEVAEYKVMEDKRQKPEDDKYRDMPENEPERRPEEQEPPPQN